MTPRSIARAVQLHLTRFGNVTPLPPILFRLRIDSTVPVGHHRPLLAPPRSAGVVHLPPSALRAIERDSPRGRVIDRDPFSPTPHDVVEFDPLVLAEWLRTDPKNRVADTDATETPSE